MAVEEIRVNRVVNEFKSECVVTPLNILDAVGMEALVKDLAVETLNLAKELLTERRKTKGIVHVGRRLEFEFVIREIKAKEELNVVD